MKTILKSTAMIAAVALSLASPAAADWCHDEVITQANGTEVASALATLESAGLKNTPIYKQLRTALNQQTNAAISSCRSDLAGAQGVMDGLVFGATGGLSAIAPGKMLHVDVGEILDGNILGGDNSFFRKNLGIKW